MFSASSTPRKGFGAMRRRRGGRARLPLRPPMSYIPYLGFPDTGGRMDDSVAKDAKRLLLRYGAPIAVVEELNDDQRISYARSLLRNAPPERQSKLKEMLREGRDG